MVEVERECCQEPGQRGLLASRILAPPDVKTGLRKPHLVMSEYSLCRVYLLAPQKMLCRHCKNRHDTSFCSKYHCHEMQMGRAGINKVGPCTRMAGGYSPPSTPSPRTHPQDPCPTPTVKAKLSLTSVLCQATLLGLGVSSGHWRGDRAPPTPSKQVDTQNPTNVHCANEKKICLYKTARVGAHCCRSCSSPSPLRLPGLQCVLSHHPAL